MGGPAGRALVAASADLLGGFGLDQRLEYQRQGFTNNIQVAAGAQCIQQLRQGRLVQGHRGELLGVNLARITLSFTRWPLALLLNGRNPALKPHHYPGRLQHLSLCKPPVWQVMDKPQRQNVTHHRLAWWRAQPPGLGIQSNRVMPGSDASARPWHRGLPPGYVRWSWPRIAPARNSVVCR